MAIINQHRRNLPNVPGWLAQGRSGAFRRLGRGQGALRRQASQRVALLVGVRLVGQKPFDKNLRNYRSLCQIHPVTAR